MFPISRQYKYGEMFQVGKDLAKCDQFNKIPKLNANYLIIRANRACFTMEKGKMKFKT